MLACVCAYMCAFVCKQAESRQAGGTGGVTKEVKEKEHIVGSLSIEKDDFDSVPFKPEGGLGKAYQLFGEDLYKIMEELNTVLAA